MQALRVQSMADAIGLKIAQMPEDPKALPRSGKQRYLEVIKNNPEQFPLASQWMNGTYQGDETALNQELNRAKTMDRQQNYNAETAFGRGQTPAATPPAVEEPQGASVSEVSGIQPEPYDVPLSRGTDRGNPNVSTTDMAFYGEEAQPEAQAQPQADPAADPQVDEFPEDFTPEQKQIYEQWKAETAKQSRFDEWAQGKGIPTNVLQRMRNPGGEEGVMGWLGNQARGGGGFGPGGNLPDRRRNQSPQSPQTPQNRNWGQGVGEFARNMRNIPGNLQRGWQGAAPAAPPAFAANNDQIILTASMGTASTLLSQ